MPSLLNPKQKGGILVGGELIPGVNFLDDRLENAPHIFNKKYQNCSNFRHERN